MFKAFGLLARMKSLRGTAFDPFGYTSERKMERALPGEYSAMIFRHLDARQAARSAAAGDAGEIGGPGARLRPHQGGQCREVPHGIRAPRKRDRAAGCAGRGVVWRKFFVVLIENFRRQRGCPVTCRRERLALPRPVPT